MPLESLLALVEELRGRIETHGDSLRQSEALTRYALIDPLLRELGWDTEDPDVVMPEFSVDIYDGIRAEPDYILMHADNQVMMIESTKLDGDLQESVSYRINACVHIGIRYFVATDGRRWEIYETYKPAPLDQKRIVSLDLMSGTLGEASLNALALWQHNLASGIIIPAQASIEGWHSLSDIQPEPSDKTPTQMMFPDNSSVDIVDWREVLINAVQWLTDNYHLDASHCPIQMPRRGSSSSRVRYVLAAHPVHPSGIGFNEAREVNALYIELDYSIPDIINNVRIIIKQVGMDASEFKLRW